MEEQRHAARIIIMNVLPSKENLDPEDDMIGPKENMINKQSETHNVSDLTMNNGITSDAR